LKRFLLVLAAIAALYASCSKEAAVVTEAPAGSPVAAVGKTPEGRPAIIMLQGLSLWTRDGDAAVWAKSATLADLVTIVGEPVELEYNKVKREYCEIAVADGSRYYVRTPYLAEDVMLAVVDSEKCVVYNEPRVIGATTDVVPFLTVVAVVNTVLEDGYVRVSYANADSVMVTDKWVRRECLVTGGDNVGAAVSLAVVGAIDPKNVELKLNILDGAAKAYSGSRFAANINNAILELRGEPAVTAEPAEPEIPSISETFKAVFDGFVIDYSTVNVRALPDIESDSVAKLVRGDVVKASERTVARSEIKGYLDHWYHIVSPVDGWVFGSLVDWNDAAN